MTEFKGKIEVIKQGDPKMADSAVSESLANEIKDFYAKIFNSKIKNGYSDESDLAKAIEGEKSFYSSVLNSINKAIAENKDKKIIALFDIDETLAKNILKEDNTYDTVIRPSAPNLLDSMNKKGIVCGLLSNRTELSEQLDDKLIILKPFINQSEIYSSRGTNWSQSDKESMDSRFPDDLRHSINNGDYEKITFIDNLISKSENGGKIFVFVDDMLYPQIFKYSIALKNCEKFSL